MTGVFFEIISEKTLSFSAKKLKPPRNKFGAAFLWILKWALISVEENAMASG